MRSFPLILTLCLLACGCKPKPAVPTQKPVTEAVFEGLREVIQIQVAAGFEPEGDIAANAAEMFEDEHDPKLIRPKAIEFSNELLTAHKRAQASWPKITDCDRLDAVFTELERAGIVCRQNFSDCNNCGAAEIGDEMEQAAARGAKVRGYVFYHSQATENAIKGHGLYLNYGAVDNDKLAAVKIGQEISAALQKQGLKVDWDGTIKKSIGVTLEWKRRR